MYYNIDPTGHGLAVKTEDLHRRVRVFESLCPELDGMKANLSISLENEVNVELF
jgi:hypothetical protein